VLGQAKVLARQIIITRQWVSDCGGVMVAKKSKGSTDASYLPNAENKGPYQKFTPAMVTRKLSEYSLQQNLYSFRITGLNPLNPENKPTPFEAASLEQFKTGQVSEIVSVQKNGKTRYVQYLVPLVANQACLACHDKQGFTAENVVGGLSVLIPINHIESSLQKDRLKLGISGMGLICLTIFTLFLLMRRFVIKPLTELTRMTSEIGNGKLDARVKMKTGDEFEMLGNALNTMAQRLAKGRDSLHEKITLATSELADANRELKTVDKLKSDFLANMSHELRSPLTVIRGGIDYLNRTIKIEDNRNYLNIIDKNLSRLIHLVSDLFDFTKIEAKKIEWSFEKADIAAFIEEVIEIISPLATDKQITISYENPGEVFVDFDQERLEQVLVNLIDNAIKFSNPGSVIHVRLGKSPNSVTISVVDQGIGILPENLKTIFDKFSTVPTGRNGKTEGTGLGLAICQAIVKAHGSKIWASSVKGKGSTFLFTLQKKYPHPMVLEKDLLVNVHLFIDSGLGIKKRF
jgi:signal transduction histidine kinase